MQDCFGPVLGGISADIVELSISELEQASGGVGSDASGDELVSVTRRPQCGEEGPVLGSRAPGRPPVKVV